MGCGASAKKDAQSPPAPQMTAQNTTKSEGPEVPPRQLRALKEAFENIDENRSGKIDASELKTLLSKVGQEDLTEEERVKILGAMDKNHDEKIEFREFVEWVLEHEGSKDAIANWSLNKGLSDMHQAAIAGDCDKIRSLLEAGIAVNGGDFNSVTPLHYAARCGKLDAAQVLIEKKADISAITSDTKRMPIHAAAEHGSVDLLKLLLSSGAEVDVQDVRKRTPLHWAACSSRDAAAAELLRAKADVNAKSIAGYTPFAMAQDWSTTALSDLIAKNGGQR